MHDFRIHILLLTSCGKAQQNLLMSFSVICFVKQERKKKGETDEQAFLADVYAYQVCNVSVSSTQCYTSTAAICHDFLVP